MGKTLQNRIIIWFGIVILNIIVGFYFTYFSQFPELKGISNVHHFHGFLNVVWLIIFCVQPVLIKQKKWELHKKVGRFSYVVMPMLLLSIIMVLRTAYHRDLTVLSEKELLSNVALGFPDFVALGTIYTLAVLNTQRIEYHVRYMIGTTFMMLGPGLGRAISGFSTLAGDDGADLSNNIVLSIAGLCLANDVYRKKSIVPFGVIFLLILGMKITFANRYSEAWQHFAEWIVRICF